MLRTILITAAAFLIWSTMGVAINLFTLTPLQLAWGSGFFAVVLLSVKVQLMDKKSVIKTFRESKKFIPLLFTAQGLHGLLWLIALKEAPIGQAVFIHSLAPIFILLLGGLLIKESYSIKSLYAVIIGLIGLGILLGPELTGILNGGISNNVLGYELSLVTAVLAACAALSLKHLSTKLSMSQLILIMMSGQVFFSTMFMFNDIPPIFMHLGETIFFTAAYAVIPFYLLSEGYKHLKTVNIALIGYVEPIFASMWGALFLNQPVTIGVLLGGGLILLSNYIAIKVDSPKV